MTSIRENRTVMLVALCAVLALSAILAIMVGSLGPIGPGAPTKLSFDEAFDALFGDSSYQWVFWDVRIPRVLMAAIVGAALACAGTAMQAVFRNSMADPFVIGVSSGAALGAAAAGIFGFAAVVGTGASPLLAFAGAIASVFVVYTLGSVKGRVYVDTLLLSGVAVASFLGAITSFLIYSARQEYHQIVFWLLGSLSLASWDKVAILVLPVIVGIVIVMRYGRSLDALLLGEETAHNLGSDPERLKKLILGVAALVTAAAVAFTGIIGFVGLIVPHMTRLVVGSNHRVLIPASALTGAIFLIWADTIARSVFAPTELPVGIITALCGGPFFLYLLRRSSVGREG